MNLVRHPGSKLEVLSPDWHLPAGVSAMVTTRKGGVSQSGYGSLNLGTHVGDEPANVRRNRDRLRRWLPDAVTIQWLKQVHGTKVARSRQRRLAPGFRLGVYTADACSVTQPNIAATVLTADCLPVLFAAEDGQQVAAAHAGWRGLLAGVLEETVLTFKRSPASITCWLGPAIGPCHFEVGGEVRAAFLAFEQARARDPEPVAACFRLTRESPTAKYLMDIYAVARLRLHYAGVKTVSGGNFCTVCDREYWFSYRRDGAVSGRMVSLIYCSNS